MRSQAHRHHRRPPDPAGHRDGRRRLFCAIASGALRAGLLLLVLTALPDVLDGAVAIEPHRLAKRSSTRWPTGSPTPSSCWASRGTSPPTSRAHRPLLPMAVLGASMLISYEQAGESLGYDAKGWSSCDAERLARSASGCSSSSVLVPILWVMLALTLVTAGQRA
ncbi:MAG: hypothetical protein R2711_10020 [Acidimicrobiales bacterium]